MELPGRRTWRVPPTHGGDVADVRDYVLTIAATAAAALLLTLLLVPALARIAPALGLVDCPHGRKRHHSEVPLVGGLALTLAAALVLVPVSWRLPVSALMTGWFAFGVAVMLVCGLLDDAFELRSWQKALLQLMAVLPPIVFGGLRVLSLGPIVGGRPVFLAFLAVPFTLLSLIGFINAVNLIDGLDGLAGGIALIGLAMLGADAWIHARVHVLAIVFAFGGAALGFLVYNMPMPWRPRAGVFLGDAGSLVLGLVVGWCAIVLAGRPAPQDILPMGVAWIMALPVMDTLTVMTRRLLRRRNPFAPDRLHLHHVLLDLGLSRGRATAVMLALSAGYGLFGLLGSLVGVSELYMLVLFFVVLCAHALFVTRAHAYARGEGTAVQEADPAS